MVCQDRKYTIIALAAGLLLITAASCKKTWEDVPLEQFTEEYVWDVEDSLGVKARGFLGALYKFLPEGYNRLGNDLLDAGSDDAISSATGATDVQRLSTGSFNSINNPDDQWNTCYSNIRKASLFLNNFHKVPLNIKMADGSSAKKAWRAEARFIRAYSYFELLKRYGGVPLMGDEVRQVNDDLALPRNSFEEVVNYIVSECDKAVDSSWQDPIEDSRYGYVTKGAVMALKARTLLYAASPLFNGGNIEAGNPLTGYTNYDAERWKLAAEASKDLIDYNKFSLQTEFKKIFITPGNREVIFAKLSGNNKNVETNNAPIGYASAVSQGRTSPTQELVDAFPMGNGLPITDPASGYDPNFPYANRDPRLTYTIFYNGAQWLNRSVQTYEGGLDKPNTNVQQTRSGYYMRKFMGAYESQTGYSDIPHPVMLFRYAEVLLNFAEAQNEYAGPGQDVYNAVQAIRERAGLNPFQLPAGLTKEAMRQLIRNERRVELAFEEHRFWDIRRWKIAEQVMNSPLHGMRIDVSSSGARTYTITQVLAAKFRAPAMYLFPVRYDEVAKNPQMKQNPGWE
ncbi:RagB/SusD family nutrient uptake outer membrane protein [Pseudobacter ginsenosidimutans]|uniref:Putative outer membrane starch-binding protein n=1 Tax=Pseudobacter ginsenosidimutans TaxID=661488 RepID=A0A4Q7MVK5_9BACT|nr:RagB/SusD family nutrient uptake outer membrane protein [Pseudobacter ginsenosidimutans]QEC42052.1 RagB/SusD family nutrient uptake outer membrane protein [Pseudobacter ginsenosidimutans]RZS71110.1 putative outer membrane starch-binding protein [Pseudobacter ginsenosidimutans]